MSESNKTKPVRAGEELNEKNLLHYMKEQGLISSASSDLVVGQFSNGYSNLTYLLEVEGKEFVLRRPPAAAPKRGHDMGREYRVQHHLKKVFSKVPDTYAFTEDTAILGAPFYIMEKVNGIILTMKEALSRKISPDEFKTISEKWVDTYVELHNVDYTKAGLETLGRPDGYVQRQVTNWGKQYLAAATDDIPAAEKVMAWMEEHQPKTYDHSLIHNDYRYDNVVFKDDQWQEISAILDWEMCTLGDPLMDLGTSLAYWATAADPDVVKKGFPSPTVMEGNPTRTELVELYASKSGRSVDNLVFYYAYGLFKLAVIVQQIYYRYKQGHTSDPRFAELNKAAALFCNTAWIAIQKNKIDNLF